MVLHPTRVTRRARRARLPVVGPTVPSNPGEGPSVRDDPGRSTATPAAATTPRLDDLVGRASVLARRLARPLGLIGAIGLAAGVVVWVLLPAPIWSDRPPWWSSMVLLALLVAPGLWLRFHRRWLDRAFVRAAELAPAATATALATYERVRSRPTQQGSGGAARRAWRFYRETVSPLRSHVADALGVTLPLRPLALATSGVAIVLTIVLCLCIPVALVVRAVLLAT